MLYEASRQIVNVYGCFWHMHTCRHGRIVPVRNAEYWSAKRLGKSARDKRTRRQLRQAGWEVLAVWECQTRDLAKLTVRIARFLCA